MATFISYFLNKNAFGCGTQEKIYSKKAMVLEAVSFCYVSLKFRVALLDIIVSAS